MVCNNELLAVDPYFLGWYGSYVNFMIFLCTLLRHLSDLNKDNALNLDEFCIAMHLVVAMRHGLELPLTLPTVLLPEKSEGTYGILYAIAKLNGYELILNVGDCGFQTPHCKI